MSLREGRRGGHLDLGVPLVRLLVRSLAAANTHVPVPAANDQLEVAVPLDDDLSLLSPLLHGTGEDIERATTCMQTALSLPSGVECEEETIPFLEFSAYEQSVCRDVWVCIGEAVHGSSPN